MFLRMRKLARALRNIMRYATPRANEKVRRDIAALRNATGGTTLSPYDQAERDARRCSSASSIWARSSVCSRARFV
jgi:hypothetical protein